MSDLAASTTERQAKRRRPPVDPKRRALAINTSAAADESFDADGEVFLRGNLAIDGTGVAMRDQPKCFQIAYEDLQLGELLGRGGSSVVLQAWHVPTSLPMALKVISVFEKSKREQLMREIHTLYNAACRGLISFYGAFYREGCITIALEFMDGGSLENALAQVGPIPEAVLANIAFQVLWALSYLKREKRVHRDIKPSNLLINSKGEVKVTDFGLSAVLSNSIAMCGTFVGTFKYMSPERIQSQPYDFSSDLWSLGLVLLESATATYPWPVDSACIEMVQTILESPAPRLPAAGFSPQFHEFLSFTIQKDPHHRLPAEVLLHSPWLQLHGAATFDSAVENVRAWIASLQPRQPPPT